MSSLAPVPAPALGSIGHEADLFELVAFAEARNVGDGPVRVVVGERGAGKTTLLSAVAGRADVHAVWLRDVSRLRSSDAGQGQLYLVDDLDELSPGERDRLLYEARRLPVGAHLVACADRRLLPALVHAGVAVTALEPLATEAAARLLASRFPRGFAAHVRERVVAEAAGNPRALIDFAEGMTVAQRRGVQPLPGPLPVSAAAARYWLPDGVRGAGGLALIALLGEVPLPWLEGVLDLDDVVTSVDEWVRRGDAVVGDDGIRLRSAILRSAAVALVGPEELTRLHGVAADVLTDRGREDRRVWHRSLAIAPLSAPAADLASALDRVAPVTQAREGDGAASEVWHRAAELADDDREKGRLLIRAARAAWRGGRRSWAQALLDEAESLPVDADSRATAALVRGMLALERGDPGAATAQLLSGAKAVAFEDPPLALDQLARAAGAAIWAADRDVVARIVEALPPEPVSSPYGRMVDQTVRTAMRMLDGDFTTVSTLRRLMKEAASALWGPRELIFAAETAGLLGDDDASLALLHRASGAMGAGSRQAEVAFALELLAHVNVWQGRASAGESAAMSGLDLAEHLGERRDGPFQWGMLAHVAALRGDDAVLNTCAAKATAAAAGVEPATVSWARGRAALSAGDFEAARSRLRPLLSGVARNEIVALFAAPDVIEAAAETGRWEYADDLLQRFFAWAEAGSPWACAVSPRLRALRAGGDAGIALLLAAIEEPQNVPRPFDDARTRLVLGRALRRSRRRGEAREHLRAAAEAFDYLGLRGWSARASAELRASGVAAPALAASQVESLTPQELEIARLIGRGMTNRAAAERLNLSARTIEYHLSKIYVKLGLSQRAQLGAALEVADQREPSADERPRTSANS